MCERILAQNCQKFDNFNFEFSMSHHNAHYQPYKKAPAELTFSTCQLEERRPVAYLQVSREPFAFERSSIEGTFVLAPPDPRTSELTQNLEKKIIFKMFNSSDQSSLPSAGDFPRARQT